MRFTFYVASALEILVVLGALLAIEGPGEHFWPTTLILFGPTWLLFFPLAALSGVALYVNRRVLIALLATALLLLIPVLGFNVPLQSVAAAAAGGARTLRLVSWNVGGAKQSTTSIVEAVERLNADVAVLQECGDLHLEEGSPWVTHVDYGLCLLSRFPLVRAEARDRMDVWKQDGCGAIIRYTLQTPQGPIQLTNVHLETPRDGFEAMLGGLRSGVAVLKAKNEQRYHEAALAAEWVGREPKAPRLVAGDFNAPASSDLMRSPWPQFRDCFRSAGWGFGHTKHTRRLGVRIDHILAGHGWRCLSAKVPEVTQGDHQPVVADLRWEG